MILEVDLEYPDKLLGLHNYYPLAPEKLKIGGVNIVVQVLQRYCRSVGGVNKLVPKLKLKISMFFITNIFSFICN